MKPLRRRWLRIFAAVVVLAGVYRLARKPWLLPKPPRPDAATYEHAKRVRIVRDTWGVPHIHGATDADAAFGLAFANAEDDFPMMQGVLAASTGRLSLVVLSKEALANDFYVGLVRVREQVAEGYDALPEDYRAVLEAYARGINLYAYLHPEQADGRFYPMSGRDIAAGFAHKIPLMLDLDKVLGQLNDGPPKHAGDRLSAVPREDSAFPGSNAHAVAKSRAPDGVTRLNVNSHQPWEGPVAWWEAQVTSDEGWNMTGGLFPGAPVILHGHNDHLGWAHTVNAPDLVDVYELTLDPKQPDHYLLDGESVALEEKAAPITIDTGFFDITVHKSVYWSEHGPVMKNDQGAWAIRYAGMGRAIQTGEQWFRMNKAKSQAEFKAAMRRSAIPMFNTVYADAEHIAYYYNALLPMRAGGLDWRAILPGNERALIWKDYLPFDELPHVEDPASGFVQNCNGTPWRATTGEGNPDRKTFDPSFGIETNVNNRSARSLALFGALGPISRDDFLRFKWDRTYERDSEIMRDVVQPLSSFRTNDPNEENALTFLRSWDGTVGEDLVAPTIATLAWRRVTSGMNAHDAFRDAVKWLITYYGKVEVPWGDVHRLRRGNVDLPLGGGQDLLNGVASRDSDDHHLVGRQGDSLVVIVDFAPGKTTSESIHQYGASNRPTSPHYADQAPLAVKRKLKPTWRTPEEQAAHTERAYHPGD